MIVALGIVAWHTRAGYRSESMHPMNLHYFGVDFFFLLSGFVLSNQIGKLRGSTDRKNLTLKFLWSRFARLWPNALTILVFSLLFESAIFAYQHAVTTSSFDPAFSSSPIWAWPLALGFGQLAFWQAWMWYGPLWSIAAIWWASVVTVAFPTPKRIRPEVFLLLLGLLVQVVCIYRNGGAIAQGQMFYGFTGLCRAVVGINLGLILRRHLDGKKYQLNVWLLALLSVLSFSIALVVDQKFHERAVLVSGVLWVPIVLLLVATKSPDERRPLGRLFLAMGKYSFPVFIWHVLIIHVIKNCASLLPATIGELIEKFPVQYLLVVIISLMLSVVSTNTIEPWIRKYLVASGEKHLKFLAPTSDTKLV